LGRSGPHLDSFSPKAGYQRELEERPFVTAELISRTTYMAIEKKLEDPFAALAAAGYSEIAVHIVPGRDDAIEDWGRIRRAFA
jgi:hypothetical protein